MTSSGRPDLTLYHRDRQNTGYHHRGSSHRTETLRLTIDNQDPPALGGPTQQGSPT